MPRKNCTDPNMACLWSQMTRLWRTIKISTKAFETKWKLRLSCLKRASKSTQKTSTRRQLKVNRKLQFQSPSATQTKGTESQSYTRFTTYLLIRRLSHTRCANCRTSASSRWCKRIRLCLANQSTAYMASLFQTSTFDHLRTTIKRLAPHLEIVLTPYLLKSGRKQRLTGGRTPTHTRTCQSTTLTVSSIGTRSFGRSQIHIIWMNFVQTKRQSMTSKRIGKSSWRQARLKMQSGRNLTAIHFQTLLLLLSKRKKFRLRSTAASEVLVSLKSTQSRVSHQSWLTGWAKWAMKPILLQYHFIALSQRIKSSHLSLVTRKSQRF